MSSILFFFFLLVHIYLRLHLNLACICAPDFSRARAHEIKREIARKGHSTSKSISYEITFGSIYGFTCEFTYELRVNANIRLYMCIRLREYMNEKGFACWTMTKY